METNQPKIRKIRNRSNQVPLPGCTTPIRDQTPAQRLTAIGFDVNEDGCWDWNGRLNADGYGVLTLARSGLHEALVHRLMYELVVGPIPAGMVVRHLVCDRTCCGNPAHLRLGSQADNVTDMWTAGRAHSQTATTCKHGHDLLPAGVRWADGSRCSTCRRNRKIHAEVRRLAPARFTAFADAA